MSTSGNLLLGCGLISLIFPLLFNNHSAWIVSASLYRVTRIIASSILEICHPLYIENVALLVRNLLKGQVGSQLFILVTQLVSSNGTVQISILWSCLVRTSHTSIVGDQFNLNLHSCLLSILTGKRPEDFLIKNSSNHSNYLSDQDSVIWRKWLSDINC